MGWTPVLPVRPVRSSQQDAPRPRCQKFSNFKACDLRRLIYEFLTSP